jgi:hypothetical protein
MAFDALDPANKIAYVDQQQVEVYIKGPFELRFTGRIIGRATNENVIDYWMVLLDEKMPGYEYSAISVPHVSIRPKGSNTPFLTEM